MRFTLLILLMLIPTGVSRAVGGDSPVAKMEPYTFVARGGQKVEAELGRLEVPENRKDPRSRRITLTFVRFKSTSSRPGPPIFYLVGGPGVSGITQAGGNNFPLYMSLREAGDLIVIDQRGTGKSNPLECVERVDYPLDRPLELGALTRASLEQARACARRWAAAGADLRGYNTNENADDVNAVRAALGFPKINIFGTSYGTHLALAFLRRHGRRVGRVVLAGTEGPDHTYKLPGQIHENLRQIARLYEQDERVGKFIPDMMGLLETLFKRLEERPATVTVSDPETGRSVEVTVGKTDLQLLVANLLPGRVQAIRSFPAAAYAMARGDFSFLARMSLQARRARIDSAMSSMMDCASGVSHGRWRRIRREERESPFGRLMDFPYPEVCEAWGSPDLGETFRSPVRSEVPALFISGTLDGRTPAANAAEVMRGFPRGSHLVVEGAGHVDASMFTPQVARLMLEFLKGQPVPGARVAGPRPALDPPDEESGRPARRR